LRGPLSLVGILVVCAGLHLLWQSRREILYWFETWFKIFRASLEQPAQQRVRAKLPRFGSQREHVLRMVLGLGLVFVLGPVLILLGLFS
jgi:hypothetical protein